MTPFRIVRGAATPLMRDNVDTDVIVRIERLSAFGRDALGPYAFETLRHRPDGSDDPDCVLNADAFRRAPILLAGRNFGCGSSREGAVWAIAGSGVRCVIAESFGDIFHDNCFQNGVLPVRLPRAAVDALASQAADGRAVTVDLETCAVTFPDGRVERFDIDARRRTAMLDGLDDVSRTLQKRPLIDAWQRRDRATRPWVWSPPDADEPT